jgi:magnesium chelatase family protein
VVRERVLGARRRLRDEPPERSSTADELLTRAVERLSLSGRGRARVARVAATIASLAGAESVGSDHLAEALSYRPPVELAA